MSFLPAMVEGESQARWLLPGVQTALMSTRADAAAEGIEFRLADFGGARTAAIVQQLLSWRDAAVKKGEPYYRVSPYAHTKHRYGAAFDIRVTRRPAGMSLEAAYARVGALARPHGLLWGGNFGAPADIFHLESQQTLEQLAPRWEAWTKDPRFPRMGVVEWSILVALVVLALLAVGYFFLRHHR